MKYILILEIEIVLLSKKKNQSKNIIVHYNKRLWKFDSKFKLWNFDSKNVRFP